MAKAKITLKVNPAFTKQMKVVKAEIKKLGKIEMFLVK